MSMKTQMTILGDGAMGTACALILAARSEFDVTLWSQFPANAEALRRERENKPFLPDVPIPDRIKITSDFHEAREADGFIVAIPTIYLSSTLDRLKADWPRRGPEPIVVSVVKGIERETFRRPSEIVADVLGCSRLAVISGPMHAEELARGNYASCVSASRDMEIATTVQEWFSNDCLRVYASNDLVGAELGGALKNVVAIAAGICDGGEFGDNAKSALMTRGLVEMVRLGVALGAERDTFYGLTGLGDLITTCISRHGRNRRVGEKLGRGEKLSSIISSTQQVAEGVWTTQGAYALAKKMGVPMPLTHEIHQVLFEDKDIKQAVRDLMRRPLAEE